MHSTPFVVATSHEPDPGREAQASLDALFESFLKRASQRNGGSAPKLRDWVDLAEAWRIAHALRECRGNRSAAARSLGIGRRTLYSKMEKLKIAPTFTAWSLDASLPGD